MGDEIAFIENERRGLAYIKIARLPIQYIQQHRGLTAAFNTNPQLGQVLQQAAEDNLIAVEGNREMMNTRL